MYDVAIIGAGPAGATFARLIGNKYRVLLLDKRQLDIEPGKGTPGKCCGGLVAPDAQKVLAELGLGIPKNVLTGPQLFTVRTIDLQNAIERYYQRFYINIDRELFDRWLVSLVPSRVDTRFGCLFKSYTKEQDGFTIVFTHNGREYSESSKIIVGADGASSLMRKQVLKGGILPKTYISIQEWFENDNTLPYFSAVFDSEVTDFYSWTIPKDDHLIVGSALSPGPDSSQKFELLKRKLNSYGIGLRRCVKREGAFILRPESMDQLCPGSDGAALLGEAGGWISPSSAEGLSYAFRSALLLAGSLEHGIEGYLGRYDKSMSSIRKNILIKNLKSPFMYNPWIRNAVMKSGLQSLNIEKV